MIKFFRHIRKKLLEQDKMGKYFKYAIGEIILVVIGILIALQINNWNENRKEKLKAKSYLMNIKEDLVLDTIQFDRSVVQINKLIDNTSKLMHLKSFRQYEVDSLVDLIPLNYFEYSIHSQTFDKLINAGVTELSDYDQIFNLINNYYTQQKNYFQSVRDWDIDQTNKDNDMIVNSSIFEVSHAIYGQSSENFHYVQSKKERREGLTKLLLSVKTRNRLKNALYRKKRLAYTFDLTSKGAKEIIYAINKKLND